MAKQVEGEAKARARVRATASSTASILNSLLSQLLEVYTKLKHVMTLNKPPVGRGRGAHS